MKVLAFDQATKLTGVACYEDGHLIYSGVLDQSKVKDSEKRFNAMTRSICKMINKTSPDLVIMEDTDLQTNAAIMKRLANMQGVIIGCCVCASIPYLIYKPTVWRQKLGFKQGPKVKREELKTQAFDWVNQNFGFEVQIDQAEAICIGAAFWSNKEI